MSDAPADIIKELTSGQRRLYGYVLTLVPSPAEADDILQETNLAILRKADTFTPGTNFLAWACRIAFNQAMTYYRKRRRELRPLFDDEVMGALASEAVEVFGGFDERLGALRGCMQKLGERKRELLQRFYFDEQSVAEIASARGQSEPTVRVTIHRIRGNLLDCIRRSLAGASAPASPA